MQRIASQGSQRTPATCTSGLLFSTFPTKKSVNSHILPDFATCPSHLNLYWITLMIFSPE